MNASRRRRISLLPVLLAGVGLAAAACGGTGTPPVNAPPASPHTAAEKAATLNWLAKTNQMWTKGNFSALDQVTTGEMRAVYQHEELQATTAKNSSRQAFQLTDLSITLPCQRSGSAIFVAYGDTDVFTLGQGLQPFAMVFQQIGGRWKLAAAIDGPGNGSGWPALCRQGGTISAPAVLAPAGYTADLAPVLTRAMTGTAVATATAAPFAVNGFLSGPDSIGGQAAEWIQQDQQAGVAFTGRFTPAPDPTFALPLANGRGYWLIGSLTQTNAHSSPAGLSKPSWPDGSSAATPRPAVIHHETDTYITTYAAIDPPRSTGRTVALDGFFGWQLTAMAS
jgi:hypothetical protein